MGCDGTGHASGPYLPERLHQTSDTTARISVNTKYVPPKLRCAVAGPRQALLPTTTLSISTRTLQRAIHSPVSLSVCFSGWRWFWSDRHPGLPTRLSVSAPVLLNHPLSPPLLTFRGEPLARLTGERWRTVLRWVGVCVCVCGPHSFPAWSVVDVSSSGQ